MKIALSRCGEMEFVEGDTRPGPQPGHMVLTVAACAICRTDAKMWHQGHRDLVLPRVLGHEIAGRDEATGQLYTVWPGQVCGTCWYCLHGRDNLCEDMKIIGFHSDGGFARYVSVPTTSLVPVPVEIEPTLLTFAEPVACVLNALSQLSMEKNQRIIIYGGGVLGMIAALVCHERELKVTVVESNQEKITKLQDLAGLNAIELCKDTVDADFDLAINCCDSHIAFSLCITKLRKGGQFSFFSGLKKNEEIETNLLNLIHYKELELFGSYGPRKEDMAQGILFCVAQERNLNLLIEKVIEPSKMESVLPTILSGNGLKHIVDFEISGAAERKPRFNAGQKVRKKDIGLLNSTFLCNIIEKIQPVSDKIGDQAQKKVDLKTKPLGALGRIEELAVRLSVIQNSLSPSVDCKRMFVFAGDHGVVEEGVSAYPAKVTVQMVENFLDGGAAINAFCRQYGIELAVVDMGVDGDFEDHPLLMKRKVARGSQNFALQKAMTEAEATLSLERGAKVFLEKNSTKPCTLVGMGEMGIGNSSSAAAIICAASGLPVEDVVGRGTGIDDRGLERKRQVIEKALALHSPVKDDALGLLTAFGGYELGGICGAIMAAALEGCCVVLDGVISTAAGLLAYLLCPEVKEYLVAGHKSVEVGQRAALDIIGIQPVLDLDMRLGEGTGAAITMSLVELSCRMMREMASFEEAGVDRGSV